jgi:hypothetical protein
MGHTRAARTASDLAEQRRPQSVRGFCVGGVLNASGQPEGPRNTVFLRRFRAHLHRLVDRMLELDR